MKKLLLISIGLFISSIFVFNTAHAYVSVNGHYRSNGTYVAPYVRSNPNGLKSDNYGYTTSHGTYNKTYGTRGTEWDTPTYITDPNYYQGKSLYESRSGDYNSGGTNYGISYPTTPTCPSNSYYDGISACKCSSGYIVSGGSCVSANSLCYAQSGYGSSYDSLSGLCKCDPGYTRGASGQCVSNYSYCSTQLGVMSQYNNLSKSCECVSGYEFNGSSCVYKTTNYSNTSAYSSRPLTRNNCPPNSSTSTADPTKCQCNTGYDVNSSKTACIATATNTNDQVCVIAYSANSYWDGTKTSDGKLNCGCRAGSSLNSTRTACVTNEYIPTPVDNKVVGKNYYLTNRTCIGLSGDQYGECISYALNH